MSHNFWLVAASLAVSLMAGFTGLSLTKGASQLTESQRKFSVVMASIALGGGIWSMHFVAMLGLQLPVLFFYDTLITLLSALIAILVVGTALLILHFRQRSGLTITFSGALVGVGILVMHYVGMSGIQMCRPEYSVMGVVLAVIVSVVLSIAAFWVAYGHRANKNIVIGTLFFGFAVFAVHFAAMAGTSFYSAPDATAIGPQIGNETLAIVVSVIVFVICGGFLLTSVTFLPVPDPQTAKGSRAEASLTPQSDEGLVVAKSDGLKQVPYEKDGRTSFVDCAAIAVIRAEGHYTLLYVGDQKLFCPWTITEAQNRLSSSVFVRAHRSYLINPSHVSSFERNKDNGICFFENTESLTKVPVSRSRLREVRDALGL